MRPENHSVISRGQVQRWQCIFPGALFNENEGDQMSFLSLSHRHSRTVTVTQCSLTSASRRKSSSSFPRSDLSPLGGPSSSVPGQYTKRLTGKGGKLNTSQAEPAAANSRAVGQFLSISCEAFIFLTQYSRVQYNFPNSVLCSQCTAH